jgi:hypothetical protein
VARRTDTIRREILTTRGLVAESAVQARARLDVRAGLRRRVRRATAVGAAAVVVAVVAVAVLRRA